MSWERVGVIAGIAGVVVGVASFSLALVSGWPSLLFGEKDHFYCELRSDTDQGGSVWTVIYRNDKGAQPWLKMVNTFGDDWRTRKRCAKIAESLENYRKDGLIRLDYRADPDTPKQYVICAKTKLSGDNCPVLVTLKPGANPYDSLRRMSEALRNGTTVDQSAGTSAASSFSPESPAINLEGYLADADRKAGSAGTK